jgi:Spy/CpxP family protein refolding chaperone
VFHLSEQGNEDLKMKTTGKLLALLASLIVICSLALAQNDATPAPSQQQNAPAASAPAAPKKSALGLTPQQKQQMRSIRESARDQAAIISHDANLTPAQRDEKLRALRQDSREQMKGVLTPEQQKTMADRRANRKARMEAQLGLTADQKAKMQETMKSAKEQRQAVLNNTSLSDQEKAAQLKQIRENTRTQMKQILTPEQQKKMHGSRAMRRMHGAHAPLGM